MTTVIVKRPSKCTAAALLTTICFAATGPAIAGEMKLEFATLAGIGMVEQDVFAAAGDGTVHRIALADVESMMDLLDCVRLSSVTVVSGQAHSSKSVLLTMSPARVARQARTSDDLLRNSILLPCPS